MDDISEKIEALLADEESMRQIKELAAMFSADGSFNGDGNVSGTYPDSPGLPDIDIGAVMRLLGAMSQSDRNCDLLIALRPHLCAERQRKLDRAVRLLKLYNAFTAMRESGMLSDFEKLI